MSATTYVYTSENITPSQLVGFFVDWPNPPTPHTHLKLLKHSDYVILAMKDGKVIGFITAISDHTLSAYIPFLEVLPAYQNQGIGKNLVTKLLDRLEDYYMIDVLCDANLQDFYEQFAMKRASGMRIRNYSRQSGQT